MYIHMYVFLKILLFQWWTHRSVPVLNIKITIEIYMYISTCLIRVCTYVCCCYPPLVGCATLHTMRTSEDERQVFVFLFCLYCGQTMRNPFSLFLHTLQIYLFFVLFLTTLYSFAFTQLLVYWNKMGFH